MVKEKDESDNHDAHLFISHRRTDGVLEKRNTVSMQCPTKEVLIHVLYIFGKFVRIPKTCAFAVLRYAGGILDVLDLLVSLGSLQSFGAFWSHTDIKRLLEDLGKYMWIHIHVPKNDTPKN